MSEKGEYKIRDQVICNNGLILSIQASSKHYCKPQSDEGPYTHVEVCTFTQKIPEWPDPICEYDDLTGKPICATYYHVPARALLHLVDSMCRGIKEGSLPDLIIQ